MAPANAQYPRTAFLESRDIGGVYGNATVTFESEERIAPIRMYVKDTACDSSDVYAHFIVYYGGGVWTSPWRYDSNGCGTSVEWNNLYIHDSRGIYAVQLEACVDSAGSNECDTSDVAHNPNLHYPDDTVLRLLISSVQRTGTANLPGPDGIVSYVGQL
jgi:hypothetical protein